MDEGGRGVTRRAARSTRPTGRPTARPTSRPTARSIALDVIRRVTDEGAYSNLTLARTLERARLSQRDVSFATELVYGTLRRLVPIDHELAPLLERPLDTAPKGARAALRLGAYQLRYLRVPAHAAVSETVALVDQRHRGFVNAVLRRLATVAPSVPEGPGDLDVSIRTGLAEWAVRELRRILPSDDETEEAAAALAERAPLAIRANTCRSTVDELERALSPPPAFGANADACIRTRSWSSRARPRPFRGSRRAGSRCRIRPRRSSCERWIRSRATASSTCVPARAGRPATWPV